MYMQLGRIIHPAFYHRVFENMSVRVPKRGIAECGESPSHTFSGLPYFVYLLSRPGEGGWSDTF